MSDTDRRTSSLAGELSDPSNPSNPSNLSSLSQAQGRRFWRSLEELAGDPAFEEMLAREFPAFAAEWPDGVSRRRFLQLASASLALGGLTACTRQPPEAIVPFVEQPENVVPGKPLFYATSLDFDGYAVPVLAESHGGRPTKIEGNPEHPASRGASDLFAQAEVLTLYDPDRSQVVKHLGRISAWSDFLTEARRNLNALAAYGEVKLRILTGPVSSPSLVAQVQNLLVTFPGARWHRVAPVGRGNVYTGARIAYGRALEPRYRLEDAAVVLSLDGDFLTQGPAAPRLARDFMAGRRARGAGDAMNRLYAVETTPTGTGATADHRLPVPAARLAAVAGHLAHRLGVGVPADGGSLSATERAWVEAAAEDLAAHSGRAVVLPGDGCPAAVHALVHAANERLGALGAMVEMTEPVCYDPEDPTESLTELTEAMTAGEVDVLLVAGANPAFDAPADLEFGQAMLNVTHRYHFGLYEDETARLCQWHIPQAHALESWGDGRAADGTLTTRQPLIEPLYDGKGPLEFFAALAPIDGTDEPDGRAVLEASLGDTLRRALHDGFVRESAPAALGTGVDTGAVTASWAELPDAPEGLGVVFRPDPTLYDGRYANNGWLQECPKPLTTLTWDNAAIVGPALAARLGLGTGDLAELAVGGRTMELPVWVQPGHPDETVTLHLGHGRTSAGRVGNGAGFDVYRIRSSAEPWTAFGASLAKRPGRYEFASTQLHSNIELEGPQAEKRHLVRTAPLERFRAQPDFAHHVGHEIPEDASLYEDFPYDGYAWGLSIDLTSCTGCNACVLACQAENNIPVVGKEQVALGREMHWIRIDRYYEGALEDPDVHYQPVMCMHCEQAPCEVVCPVAATTHSDEGLNEMTYNRCVGTRYCANNCPYKVRRFNFLLYQDFETPVLKLMRNPDVTVRSRGVMEKCSYCVQRINQARIDSGREGREIRDGEVVTACQQACPTEAIVFGDTNDAGSRVAQRKALPLDYGILEELSTKPRTTYLARITNPNPALAGTDGHEPTDGHG